MAKEDNLTPWPKGVSGNPAGKPKGALSLSTHIQRMMEDDSFEIWLEDTREGFKQYKGAPMKAIIATAMKKSAAGDTRWADWLAKYGYGTKVDVTTNGKDFPTPILGSVTVKKDE